MLLDINFLMENWTTVLLVVALVALGKFGIFGILTRLFGYVNIAPLAVALTMFQIGEFSFLLARVGLSANAIDQELYSLVLATAVTTMILTPIAARTVGPIHNYLGRFRGNQDPYYTVNIAEEGLHGHVIIAGAGRVGQYISGVLQQLHLNFVAIELNQYNVEICKERGIPVIYGDASHPVVLEAAGLDEARLLLITTPTISATHAIIDRVRQARPDLHIVARAEGMAQMETLYNLGIYEVVQPELEAGLEITRQALLHLNLPPTEIQRFTDAVRREHYAPLYSNHPDYQAVIELQHAQNLLELNWVTLSMDSPLVGHSIVELDIRQQTGVSVVAVICEETLLPNPPADYRFCAGERVAVLGDRQQLEAFEILAAPHHANGGVEQAALHHEDSSMKEG
jgi:monovalent cation:H+ antiporter-2, CPA2 family